VNQVDQKEYVKDICSKSIEAFISIFMAKAAYAATPEFHKAIYSDLQDGSIKRLAIIAPRGHAKSTATSIVYPLWKICNHPANDDYFCIIISESQAQSINFLTVIKNNLQSNHLLRAYYGDLVGEKWTEEEIVTKNHCRVVAKGTGQKIRGLLMGSETITRPKDIIMDDFESENNSDTHDKIDKNIKWITKAVEPSLADDGRLITIGTIIHERAYLNRLRKDPSFKTHFYQAIVGANGRDLTVGQPLWKERFPLKKLLGIKASYESRGEADAFWQEYMNIAVSLDDQTFRPEWNKYEEGEYGYSAAHNMGYIKRGNIIVPLGVGIGVDLAISISSNADFTVVAAVGTDYEGNKYLLEYRRLKTNRMSKIIDNIFEMSIKYHASTVNIETVQFQQIIANEFRDQMVARNTMFGIVESKPRTSKDSRIKALQPLFSAGKFYQREHMNEFRNELFGFPNAAHDDILDAVWFANEVSHPPEVGSFVNAASSDNRLPAGFYEGKSWIAM
jgi:predicted phage terminase large subunit-like protein